MVKFIDTREREKEILDLVIKSYIKESRPISSGYLCDKYNLPYSSATVRNIMEVLEKRGFLSHIHTSSGRVPTKKGFKYYVARLKEEDFIKEEYTVTLQLSYAITDIEGVINRTLDTLAQVSGYTSLVAISGRDKKIMFKGTRFILEQPEFGDIERLKNLFYTLEVKIGQLQHLLFNYLDEKVQILIGEETGLQGISDCALLISGSKDKRLTFSLGLLGPVRMDYIKAASCLYSIKRQFKRLIKEFLWRRKKRN
jgi:transcriptional regulator of heat shock response